MATLVTTALLLVGCGDGEKLAEYLSNDVDPTVEQEAASDSDAAAVAPLDRDQEIRLIEELKAFDGIGIAANKIAAGTERQTIFFIDSETGRPGKKVKAVRDVKKFSDNTFVVDGLFAERYPNDQRYQQGNYRDGQRDGEWKFWHSNGTIAKVVHYKDGKEDGAITVFRADGTKELSREYKAGKRHGKWLSYDETGEKPNGQLEFDEGVPHGTWMDWYESGKPREEKQIKHGKPDGTLTQWHANGKVAHRTDFKAGKRHGLDTVFNTNGQKIREIRYDEGKVVPNVGS
jgi:antitoxin component YwqK of YwqJK toxin-antitoxin module